MNTYKRLEQCWLGLKQYNLNGKDNSKELYNPITMDLPEWQNYVASGRNTLELSGGVIPDGTVQTAFGNSGVVFNGNVNQNQM